jgi:hypothetical protein
MSLFCSTRPWRSNAPILDWKPWHFLEVTPVSRHDHAADLKSDRGDAKIHLGHAKFQGVQVLESQDGRFGERQNSKLPSEAAVAVRRWYTAARSSTSLACRNRVYQPDSCSSTLKTLYQGA